jgi:hypothetical protein
LPIKGLPGKCEFVFGVLGVDPVNQVIILDLWYFVLEEDLSCSVELISGGYYAVPLALVVCHWYCSRTWSRDQSVVGAIDVEVAGFLAHSDDACVGDDIKHLFLGDYDRGS